jgi:hypothetical protein
MNWAVTMAAQQIIDFIITPLTDDESYHLNSMVRSCILRHAKELVLQREKACHIDRTSTKAGALAVTYVMKWNQTRSLFIAAIAVGVNARVDLLLL